MTAIASLQPADLSERPKKENFSDYVSTQLHQPFAQPPRHAVSSVTLRQDSVAQDHSRGRRRTDRNVANTGSLIQSRSDIQQGGQDTTATGQSIKGRDTALAKSKPQLLRANTDHGPRRQSPLLTHDVAEENWELRHGWEDQYNSSEYLGLLSSVSIPLFYLDLKCHRK